MSTPEPTHLPIRDAELEALAYQLSVAFYPRVKLSRKAGHAFATDLDDFIESDVDRIEAGQWFWECGSGNDKITIRITSNELEFRVQRPVKATEWYEHRCRSLLSLFGDRFELEAMLGSRAVVRGLLKMNGDSRAFVGGRLMKLDPDRIIAPMKRPVHIVGLRLVFPPYREMDDSEEEVLDEKDWSVTVRVESWGPDPSRLYLEADARWISPCTWDDDGEAAAVGRLSTVTKFVGRELRDFLLQPDDSESDDD